MGEQKKQIEKVGEEFESWAKNKHKQIEISMINGDIISANKHLAELSSESAKRSMKKAEKNELDYKLNLKLAGLERDDEVKKMHHKLATSYQSQRDREAKNAKDNFKISAMSFEKIGEIKQAMKMYELAGMYDEVIRIGQKLSANVQTERQKPRTQRKEKTGAFFGMFAIILSAALFLGSITGYAVSSSITQHSFKGILLFVIGVFLVGIYLNKKRLVRKN